MKVRSIATITALAATPLLATPAAQAAPSAQTVSGSAIAASRSVAVPGVPMSIRLNSGWPTLSPKSLYNSRATKYSASVRFMAKVSKQTPKVFVNDNRAVNLMSYGRARRGLVPVIQVIDMGTQRVSVERLKLGLKRSGATVLTTSQVKTRLGMGYRVHYSGLSNRGHRAYGVLGFVMVNGRSVGIDSTALTMKSALSNSNTAFTGATRR